MGFSFHSVGNWLVGAGRAVGKQFDHLATGAVDVAKALVNQPIALAHELSGAVVGVSKNLVGVAHEAGGALVGVSSALTMPLMVAGGAALVFMMTQRR